MVRNPLQPPTCHRGLTGVDQRHAPRLGILVMYLHTVFGHVEGDIRHVQEVIGEVFLDHIALVTTADHEIGDTMSAIDFHNVPQDRTAADFDHGLGTQVAFFGNPRAQTTGKYHGFHIV